MTDHLSNILSKGLYALMGISVLLAALFFAGFGITESGLIIWSYMLAGIAAATAVLFPIVYLVQNPKKAKGALFSVAGLLAIFGIAWLFASGDVLDSYEKYDIDEVVSRRVGMGLIAMYILGFGAIGAIIYSAVSRLMK
jgi:hypothetical protein